MKEVLIQIERFIWSVPQIALLMISHIFFTIKLRFPQFKIFSVVGEIIKKRKEESKGEISSYKTLMATLAGTLGTGNIVGVATAICIGGIGSIFWIFISGFLAIATKYAETYIVLKYRKKDKSGYVGGAMYVLRDVLGNNVMAVLFSIFIIIASFGIGAMIQSSSATQSLSSTFSLNEKICGIVITAFCAYILIGNAKKITNVSSILVPFVSITYILMCAFIIFIYRGNIMTVIFEIINDAFNVKAAFSGSMYVYVLNKISSGLSNGLFSNEAGMGSSPMFDVLANEKDIEKQSLISSFAVFCDTVLICTLTGITICSTFSYIGISDPIVLIGATFSKIPFGNILISISLIIFSITTIPCWNYYGTVAINFLFRNKKIYVILYKLVYIAAIYVGAISDLEVIFLLSGIANALMCIPNIYMIFMLNKEITIKSSHKIFTKMK